MLIQCTKKLLERLKIEPGPQEDEEPIFSWHANLVTIDRRKAVVLLNDKNNYIIVLYGLRAKDFEKFDDLVPTAIYKTFQKENIRNDVIEKYLSYAGEIKYSKTKNRSILGKLNNACSIVQYYADLLDVDSILQPSASIKVSRYMVGGKNGGYVCPNKEMYKDLEELCGKPIFNGMAVVIKVTLDLEGRSVWRKLIVPLNTTFDVLHEILQTAFEWKDYHLHKFIIYSNEKVKLSPYVTHHYHKNGYAPIVELVCDDEDEYENISAIPTRLEKGVMLSEYIPEYKRLRYIYDFGDNWDHYIEVEEVVNDYFLNYATCIEGEGNAPPEDVGSSSGYEEFLKIIADEQHPEHENMVEWGRYQGYKDFDIEEVNRRLKNMWIR
ncbi:plasmid pRiA4b ORF-3 family protein [Mahella australiensis]|uniref:Plasmid pRiA4b ORF-3 family protein n=1 Tax=Mahella australiensis (strain DSM 15567 / CIP 107919 / 50-1 BON) TaxID=697281 RepID=F3ZXB0_MAHA5|nr:plasmid pRiA4b ORF-3 family protein [Mahella australiensis]AEE96567.1 plasmid pRiA4b ORF-3 family protein [Mahella australiensis 50-1 BON]